MAYATGDPVIVNSRVGEVVNCGRRSTHQPANSPELTNSQLHEHTNSPIHAPRRVLIVDDDLGRRETLGRWLRTEGDAVDVAASGREALEQVVAASIDAILLDYHLPDMDGLECLRAMRARRPGLHPPVVLFTADWEVQDDGVEAGALGATIASKLTGVEEVERLLASLCAMAATRAPAKAGHHEPIPP